MSESLDKTRSRVWNRSQDWAFLYCCVKKSDHSSWFSASCSSLPRDQLNWRSLGSFQLPLRLCRAPENSRDVPKMRGWVISKAWITTEHGVDRKLYTGKTSCPLPIIIIIFFKDLTRALGWEKSAALQGWSTQGCRWLKLTSRVFCRRGHIHHLSLQTFLSFLLLSSLWLWITTASTMGTCSLLHLAHPNKIQTRNCCQCGAIYPLALSWGSCWIYLGSVKSRICCRVFGPAQLSRVSVINKLSSVM